MDDHRRMKRLDVMEQVMTCTACELAGKCTSPVPMTGTTPARIAIVGEAPSSADDAAGEPFAGPAGDLLREALAPYESILGPYALMNVVSCAPGGAPTAQQVLACAPNRTAQLRIIDPEFVLLLGATATKAIAPTLTDFNHARRHPFLQNDRQVYVPAHHPAAGLAHGPDSERLRQEFLEDIAFFVEVVANGREGWTSMIPDECSGCGMYAEWWTHAGLGWCPVHLPDREREKYDAWFARLAEDREDARKRLEEPTVGSQTALADAVAAKEHRTASEAYREAAGLSDVDQNEVQIRGGARETEKQAAWAVFPKTGTQRRGVLTLIAESVDGRTDQEIEADLGLRPSSASTRRSELERGGWVEDSGKRRLTAAGNEAIVWVLTDAARAELVNA